MTAHLQLTPATCQLDDLIERIRELRKNLPWPTPLVITLEPGVYELSQTLTWDEQTLGYVTIRSAEAGQAIIRGAKPISAWKPCKVNGVNAWVAEIPEVKRGDWYFRSLFVNGERAPRARCPKFDVEKKDWQTRRIAEIRTHKKKISEMGLHEGDNCFRPAHEDIKNWPSLHDAEAVVLHYWIEERLPNLRLDPETGWLHSSHATHFGLRAQFNEKLAPYYIDNLFEALTDPGEWYLKRSSGELYYIPKEGETPQNCEIWAPHICQFARIGSNVDEQFQKLSVEQVHFEGLRFEMSDWQPVIAEKERHDSPPLQDRPFASSAQNSAHVPGAIHFKHARHCSVRECTLRQIGFFAVVADKGCGELNIQQNQLTDLGAGGVKVVGGDGLNAESEKTERIVISDNEIHRLGRVFHAAPGVVLIHAAHNTVTHNHISDLFASAIGCGMIWSYNRNRTHHNRIAYNHIHHYGQGMLSDMGGVYVLGVQPGTNVENNWIHHASASEYGAHGIYLDECAAHVAVTHNVVHDIAGAAFLLHKGRDNLVLNNLFHGSGWSAFEISNQDWNRGLIALRNIIVCTGMTPNLLGGYGLDLHKTKSVLESNLHWNESDETPRFGNVRFEESPHYEAINFAQWQKLGYERTSIAVNPRIKGLGSKSLRLETDSPAMSRIGFQPINLNKVGPRQSTEDAVEEKFSSVTDMRFA